MKKTMTVIAAVTALSAVGCAQQEAPAAPEPAADAVEAPAAAAEPAVKAEPKALTELDVEQASALHAAQGAVFLDANSDSTRTERGVVPGATLLTSSGRYDLAKELPADKSTKLVFYCGSEHCTASDGAAERAADAGYEDVCVMRPGIKGWVAAGKQVQKPDTAS